MAETLAIRRKTLNDQSVIKVMFFYIEFQDIDSF